MHPRLQPGAVWPYSGQLLQHIYQELSRGDFQTLLQSLADDIRWTINGTSVLSGTAHGEQEVIDHLLALLRAWLADGPDVFSIEPSCPKTPMWSCRRTGRRLVALHGT